MDLFLHHIFALQARENKFLVRDFTYNEEALKSGEGSCRRKKILIVFVLSVEGVWIKMFFRMTQ